MNNEKEILRYDFQGWPVYKQTVQNFLDNLGIEIKSIKDESTLNKPLVIRQDDGSGYGVKENFVEDIYENEHEVNIWYFK